MTKEYASLKEYEEAQLKMIGLLNKKFPERFLLVENLYVKIKGQESVLIPIGLYTCADCGIPISHAQMAWSGYCGPCDIGKNPRRAKWKIIKPILPEAPECRDRSRKEDGLI